MKTIITYCWLISAILLCFSGFGCIGEEDAVLSPAPFPPRRPSRVSSDDYPDWAADGKKIVYRHMDSLRDSINTDGVYCIDVDGNNKRLFLKGHFYLNPKWSPDGHWIAYINAEYGGKSGLEAHHVWKKSVWTIISHDVFSFNWTSDGKHMIYRGPPDPGPGLYGVWIRTLDTGSQRLIDKEETGRRYYPAMSPDGRWVITTGSSPDAWSSEIYLMDTQGNTPTQLTRDYWNDEMPRWSPDGKRVAWTREQRDQYEVAIMNADGSKKHKLTDGRSPAWSPDGTKIVFSHQRLDSDRQLLWIINADGSGLRQLTK